MLMYYGHTFQHVNAECKFNYLLVSVYLKYCKEGFMVSFWLYLTLYKEICLKI